MTLALTVTLIVVATCAQPTGDKSPHAHWAWLGVVLVLAGASLVAAKGWP